MKVYLVRHGDAEAKRDDLPKALSTLGKKEVKTMGRFLAASHVKVSYVFHSGKLRAEQTASALAKALAFTGPLEQRSGMEPHDLVSPLVAEMNQLDGDALYVGHMPFLSKLVARALIGTENHEIFSFQTASIVCLERVFSNGWTICWALSPQHLYKKSK